jgi:hypothetical protein
MFREGKNSKAAIDVVQQDDDGAVEHVQQHAPGQALRTSGANLTTINSVAPFDLQSHGSQCERSSLLKQQIGMRFTVLSKQQ